MTGLILPGKDGGPPSDAEMQKAASALLEIMVKRAKFALLAAPATVPPNATIQMAINLTMQALWTAHATRIPAVSFAKPNPVAHQRAADFFGAVASGVGIVASTLPPPLLPQIGSWLDAGLKAGIAEGQAAQSGVKAVTVPGVVGRG